MNLIQAAGHTRKKNLLFYRFIAALILFVLPVTVYWSAVFHRYGFRDDYSIIQEASEEPGKVFKICAAYARPVYGVLLETTASWIEQIDDLKWMRLAGAVSVGVLSAVAFFTFVWLGWGIGLSALLAATISLLPAAQLISSWAICWPHGLAAILGLLAFYVADHAIRMKSSVRRYMIMLSGSAILALGILSYQQHSLFYFVGIAAGFVLFPEAAVREKATWVAQHLVVVFVGLAFSVIVMTVIFQMDIVAPTSRLNFEADPLGKLWWFAKGSLKNALGVVVLNDELGRNRIVQFCVVVLSCGLLSAGVWRQWKKAGALSGFMWLAVLILLALLSYSVNLASSDRYVAYRHIWALTSTLIIFSVAVLKTFSAVWPRVGKVAAAGALGLLLVASVVLAHAHTYELVALPQSEELALIEKGARKIDITKRPRVFIVVPSRKDAPSVVRVADEFGSLSTDSDWVPREMLEKIMKERYPNMQDVTKWYYLKSGEFVPPKQPFEVVIDLRKLKKVTPEEALDQLGPLENDETCEESDAAFPEVPAGVIGNSGR